MWHENGLAQHLLDLGPAAVLVNSVQTASIIILWKDSVHRPAARQHDP